MGIYDNLNTTVPNLISGGNLNNAAYQLGNSIDKTFGNAQGGILDFWKGQQDAIQARNTTMYQNAVKGLTPEQLRQLEEQGINPYTDLPGLMGYGKGVLLDTDKAFESAANAGTALSNANNTWLGQQISNFSPDEQKAIAKTADPYNTMLDKLRGLRPGLRFFDEPGLVTKANEVATQGFNQLADEAAELNKATALNQRLAAGPGGYALEQGLDPKVDNRLRQKLHQEDINQYSKEAATKIKEWQYLNGSEDWTRAIQELGLNPQWINNDVLKEAGVFTTEGQQISRDAFNRTGDLRVHQEQNRTKVLQAQQEGTEAVEGKENAERKIEEGRRNAELEKNKRDVKDSLFQKSKELKAAGLRGVEYLKEMSKHRQDLWEKYQGKISDSEMQQAMVDAMGADNAAQISRDLYEDYVEKKPETKDLFTARKDSSGRSVIDIDAIENQRQATFNTLERDLENAGLPQSVIEMSKKLFEQKWTAQTEHAKWFNTVSHDKAAMDATKAFQDTISGYEHGTATAYTFLNNYVKGGTTDPYAGYSIKQQTEKDALWGKILEAAPKGTNAYNELTSLTPEGKNYLISLYLYEAAPPKGADTAEKVAKNFKNNHSNELTRLIHYASAFNKMVKFARNESPQAKMDQVKPRQ